MTALPPPHAGLAACVVVPARDEEELVGACLEALAGQVGVAPGAYEVLLLLDRCADATETRARVAAARHPWLRLHIIRAALPGVGHARREGMDLAASRLPAHGLIATTDADSRPAPDWLRVQLDAVAGGAQAIGGRVELGEHDRAQLPPAALARRAAEARARHARVREEAHAGATEHHQFSGASLAVTVATYATVGPIEPRPALEDEAFERALRRHRIPIDRLAAVKVTTSGRRAGRAERGLAVDLRRSAWLAERRHAAGDYPLDRLLAAKDRSISVILPAREVAGTLGPILDAIAPLERAGLVDELLVVDAASADGSAELARARGARAEQQDDLLAAHGPALGKGDAMWRGLAATSGELVCFLDADTEDFTPGFVLGLLGALLTAPGVSFVKGFFRRPLRVGDAVLPEGGGRVTELVARPYLNLHLPELAGFLQPLAGEIAAERGLLERIPFPVGYGVEIAMLIDVFRTAGLDAMAQVDLGTRQNRHQRLQDLSAMALEVLAAAEARVHGRAEPGAILVPAGNDFERRAVTADERPPLASLRAEGFEAGRFGSAGVSLRRGVSRSSSSPPSATARP